MDLTTASSSGNQLCKLCNRNERRYVCPRCNIAYCSVECYKSSTHLECSEAFYKQCVENELLMQQGDPDVKQKTLEMLQRVYNNDVEDDILTEILQDANEDYDYEADLDSDDENLPSLEKRLKNINLDNADELWSALTTSERQEFEALISSGEASKLLPQWNPWWRYTTNEKLVQDLTENKQDQTFRDNCPKILDTPALEGLSKVSPFLRYSIINTIYCYAYTVMHFNGEHHSTPLDATYVFLHICDTIRINRIFKDIYSTIESVMFAINQCNALVRDSDTILGTKEAGDAILKGPNKENKLFYVLAALSDSYKLIEEARKEISLDRATSANNEFKSKFQSNIDLGSTNISKKTFTLFLKKIEFYITWLKSHNGMYDITEGESI
ncbi:zinc finger HIT domain-containing protein 2 [Phymastichus coffea]|uniref:zinc finger HIT domain-containing protein 2 n=1 Tax=Phymastichus coffea TaxID=108790 RepID=UPI00273BB463|nr:zinc finger HIT domain-containing protein 2 [Phymastichus coffea]